MLINSLEKYRNTISLVFILSFCLINLFWKSNILSQTANRTTLIFDFFNESFSSMGKGITQFFNSYASYQNLKAERDALKNKVEQNRDLKLKNTELLEENARLRQLLQIPPLTEFPVVQAEVISIDPDNWFRTIIINKGSADGITPYMPVMTVQIRKRKEIKKDDAGKIISETENEDLVQAVVGKVIQVNRNSARVLSIVDKYSRLGVQIKRTGHWAMLIGQSSDRELPMIEYLSLALIPKPGEEVITSGAGGIFPKNLLVGYLGNKVERLGSFQKAELKPAVDFQKIDYVYVIKKKWDNEQFEFKPLTTDSIAEP